MQKCLRDRLCSSPLHDFVNEVLYYGYRQKQQKSYSSDHYVDGNADFYATIGGVSILDFLDRSSDGLKR